MNAPGVDHDKDNADQRGEEQVDRDVDELLYVGSHFLKLAQSLSASLIFELRIRKLQRMPDTVGIEPRSHLLCDQIDEVVLEVLRHTRNKRHADGHSEKHTDTSNELGAGVLGIASCIRVYDVAEDQGIEQGKHLVDRGQNQRGGNQLP